MIVGQVRYDVVDRVGFPVIDRAEKRNALSRQVLEAIAEVLDAAGQTENLCAVAVTGAGDRSFASGGDLVALSSLRTPDSARDMAVHARSVLDRLRRFPLPVVAALNGDALGGGAELALACDFRVLAARAAPTWDSCKPGKTSPRLWAAASISFACSARWVHDDHWKALDQFLNRGRP